MTPDANEASNDGELASSDLPLAARSIKALLTRLGYPGHKHTGVVAGFLGVTTHQAKRKLSGISSWDVEEMAALCQHLGYSIADVLDAGASSSRNVMGVVIQGSERLPCTFWLGDEVTADKASGFVAERQVDTWHVGKAKDLLGPTFREARRVVLEPGSVVVKPTVAVLDDSVDGCDTLCEVLDQLGFAASPFYTVNTLLEALRDQSFDCYVLDWLLPGSTAAPALARIRELSKTAPITLYTGKVVSGEASLHGITDALQRFDVDYVAKPAPAAIIATTLKRGLGLL